MLLLVLGAKEESADMKMGLQKICEAGIVTFRLFSYNSLNINVL